jgi:hypothetical protein
MYEPYIGATGILISGDARRGKYGVFDPIGLQ